MLYHIDLPFFPAFRRHRRRSRQRQGLAVPETTILQDGLDGRSQSTTLEGLYEERTPMLLKNHKCFHKGEGDYGDVCEMQLLHSTIGNDVKGSRTSTILKCQSTRTLPRGPDMCPSHAQHIENCNAYPVNTLKTFKPSSGDQNLYEMGGNREAKSVLSDHIRLYHELDPSMLPNCHGPLHEAMFVVSNENARVQDNMPNVIPEGLDNDANTLKEHT